MTTTIAVSNQKGGVAKTTTCLSSGILFETIIEVDTKLRESPAFAQPITLYAPKTRGAEQYRALAKELLNHGR